MAEPGRTVKSFKSRDWPEAVVRGVELLSWMVAEGHLEVRVAFRVHGKTGKPLPYADTGDG